MTNKQKRIRLLVFIFYTCYLFVAIILSRQLLTKNYNFWLHSLNLLVLITLLIQLIIGKIMFQKFVNFCSILLFLSLIFHLSFPFVLEYGGRYAEDVTYKLKEFDENTFRLMVTYAYNYISLLFEGMLFYDLIRKKTDKKPFISRVLLRSSEYHRLGKILLLIFLPLDLLSLFVKLSAMFRGGYGESFTAGSFLKYYSSFGSYLILSAVFLLWETSSAKKSKYYLVAYIFYQVVWMFSGQRAMPVVSIILALYLYFCFGRRITIRAFIALLFGGVIGVLLLNVIREFRAVGFSGLNLRSVFSFNLLFDTLTEFGVTLNVFGYVIDGNIDHNIGFCFIYDVLFVIPKVSWLGVDTPQFNIYEALDLSAAGSSYLAEILFDFKQFGYCVVFLYGMFIRTLDTQIEKHMDGKNLEKVAYLIPLGLIVLFCVRTGTANILRVFIWSGLLLYIVKKIFLKKSFYYQKHDILSY